jgi:FkbM family methyltransferase
VIRRLLGKKKERFEEIARERLLGSPAFPVVRTAYQSVFNRGKLNSRRQMMEFYSQFVRPGDLVFDVGANVGMYAEIFSELKARVVAVEPNPECVRSLDKLAQRTTVKVEPFAVSDRPGTIALQLSGTNQLSTANPEWRSRVEKSEYHHFGQWTEEIKVECVTLDQLAKRHGNPKFVKIDVEGFDDRVMFGISFKPSALTFEFNRVLPAVAMNCLEAPVVREGYEFNVQNIGTFQYVSPVWLGRKEIIEKVESLVGPRESADIVARLKAAI